MFSRLSLPKALPGHDKDQVNQDATCAEVLSRDIHWDQIPDKEVKKIIKGAFRSLTRSLKAKTDFSMGGTTASIALQIPYKKGTRVFFANAGDSCGMLLAKSEEKDKVDILSRTKDHAASCPEEQARIIGAGGRVGLGKNGVMRIVVNGFPSLAPSRGFGDYGAEPSLTHTPIVTKKTISRSRRQYVRVAHFSDGIYKALPEGWVYKSPKNRYFVEDEQTRAISKVGSQRYPGAVYMLSDTDRFDKEKIEASSWALLSKDPNKWLERFLVASQKSAHEDAYDIGVEDSDDTTGEVVKIATPESGALLSGVFDGHGLKGGEFSKYVSENIGSHIMDYIKRHCPKYSKKAKDEPSLLRFFVKNVANGMEKAVSPALSDAGFFEACHEDGAEFNQGVSVEEPALRIR